MSSAAGGASSPLGGRPSGLGRTAQWSGPEGSSRQVSDRRHRIMAPACPPPGSNGSISVHACILALTCQRLLAALPGPHAGRAAHRFCSTTRVERRRLLPPGHGLNSDPHTRELWSVRGPDPEPELGARVAQDPAHGRG